MRKELDAIRARLPPAGEPNELRELKRDLVHRERKRTIAQTGQFFFLFFLVSFLSFLLFFFFLCLAWLVHLPGTTDGRGCGAGPTRGDGGGDSAAAAARSAAGRMGGDGGAMRAGAGGAAGHCPGLCAGQPWLPAMARAWPFPLRGQEAVDFLQKKKKQGCRRKGGWTRFFRIILTLLAR